MSQAPTCFQLHVISGLLLFAAPVGYLTRPYIVHRSKDPRRESERRGWEKVDFCWPRRLL